jgi:hypothetical protein
MQKQASPARKRGGSEGDGAQSANLAGDVGAGLAGEEARPPPPPPPERGGEGFEGRARERIWERVWSAARARVRPLLFLTRALGGPCGPIQVYMGLGPRGLGFPRGLDGLRAPPRPVVSARVV